MARKDGSTDPANDDECAIVVPAITAGEALAGAEADTGATDPAAADGVCPAVVGAGGTTPCPRVEWVGMAASALDDVAGGVGEAGGGALTRGSSAPSRVGTIPRWLVTAAAARSANET
jgi:hypothetical protein